MLEYYTVPYRFVHFFPQQLILTFTTHKIKTMRETKFHTILQELTPRQNQVLQQFLAGQTDKAIATSLCVEASTICRHLANICKPFGLSNFEDLGNKGIYKIPGFGIGSNRSEDEYSNDVQMSTDGKRIATVENNNIERNKIKVWDEKGNQLAEYDGYAMTLHPNGDKIVVVSADDNIPRLWQIDDLDELLKRGCEWLDSEEYRMCQQESTIFGLITIDR
jgi:DNA-binding CsgD family transcriptional regulator